MCACLESVGDDRAVTAIGHITLVKTVRVRNPCHRIEELAILPGRNIVLTHLVDVADRTVTRCGVVDDARISRVARRCPR